MLFGVGFLPASITILIAFAILIITWKLLLDSLQLSLDGVPDGVSLEEIVDHISKIPNLKSFSHVHIWAMSITENALTAHLSINEDINLSYLDQLKSKIKHDLLHFNIHQAGC